MREAGSDFVEGQLLVNCSYMMQNQHEAGAWNYAISCCRRKLSSRFLVRRPLSSLAKQQFQEKGFSRRRCVKGSMNLLGICDP